MSKAILVINEPNNCKECPISAFYKESAFDVGEFWCPLEVKLDINPKDKPWWCPLKPLPDNMEHYIGENEYYEGCVEGWNDCLDEIIGR